MRTRRLGDSDLLVSPICLGTMLFCDPVDRQDAIHLVHEAMGLGINFIDTADIYEGYRRTLGSSGGVAEEILGEALEGRRDRVVITTKVGNAVGPGPLDRGLSPEHIGRQIEASLRRLRTDYVDVYELHAPDPETDLAVTVETMAGLVTAGKIRCWGFSNFVAADIERMVSLCEQHGWPKPVVSQPPYSWLRREVEAEHLPTCRRLGIAVTPYQPLQGGLLTGRYHRGLQPPEHSRAAEKPMWMVPLDDEVYTRLEKFEREARSAGLTPSQYAIRWLLDQPGIVSVVAGARQAGQLEEIVSVF